MSQISKSANSSVGDSIGCASPSPLICVTSYSGSHFARVSTYSRVTRLFVKDSMIGNMRPFERLPLCAIASMRAPVRVSTSVIHFHKSTGFGLPSGGSVVYGSVKLAFEASSRKITLRCRLLPPSFEVHSKPMNAVKRPGSLASSAALIVVSHALR